MTPWRSSRNRLRWHWPGTAINSTEVSAYARAGQRCRHNLNYWEFGDYLGIGAGAHGKLSDPASGRIHRLWKLKHPRPYLATAGTAAGIGGDASLREAELPVEFLMNALRLVEGVPARLFAERTGLPLAALEPGLSRVREAGLLQQDPERLQASERGLRFLNDLLQEFMPSDDCESARERQSLLGSVGIDALRGHPQGFPRRG